MPSSLPPEADGLPVPGTAGSFNEVKTDNGAVVLEQVPGQQRDRLHDYHVVGSAKHPQLRSMPAGTLTSGPACPHGARGRHGVPGQDEPPDVRWVVLHMIEETARHAGHLDIARELIDGQTGLGPR